MTTKTETHTTRNGQTVELRSLAHGKFVVRTSAGSRFTYEDETYARYVANVLFMTLATGCYACALDAVGRKVRDNSPHTCH